jgi:hypothetical protein
MSDGANELKGYYKLEFDTYIELIKEVDSMYFAASDLLHSYISSNDLDLWDNTPIPELADYYVAINDLRIFLDELINKPTEEELRLALKFKLNDLLLSEENLVLLDNMVSNTQYCEKRLYDIHKIVVTPQ